MPEFLVELYVAHDDHDAAQHQAQCAAQAAAELTREGRPAQCVRSIFVPEDETCFLLYDALSADVVEEAVRRAGFRHAHISASFSDGPASPAGASAAVHIPTKGTTTMSTTTNDIAD